MADALMVWPPKGDEPPDFLVVPDADIGYWRWRGAILLISERDVRRADIDDVRREDESRGRSG